MYLCVSGGQGNFLEHSPRPHFTIRVVIELVRVDVVVVWVFFFVEVVKVSYFLFVLRIEIWAHLFLQILLLIGFHLLIANLGLLHTLEEGHQLSFSVLDIVLVLQVQLLAFFWIFWKKIVLVTEGVEEHQL